MQRDTPSTVAWTGKQAPRWRQLLRRVTESNEELENEDLVRQAADAGATPISDCPDRQRVSVQGHIATLTVNPQGAHRWLEADLVDGSGTMTLIWMGRRSIPGVMAGRKLRATGLIGRANGRKVMYNPSYELLPQ